MKSDTPISDNAEQEWSYIETGTPDGMKGSAPIGRMKALERAANDLAEALTVIPPWGKIGYLDFLSRSERAAITAALSRFAKLKKGQP